MNSILVTGSRYWTDRPKMRTVMKLMRDITDDDTVLLHGDAKGADKMAAGIWSGWSRPVKPFYAEWSKYGNAAGPKRNQRMVDEKPSLCIGFLMPGSRGTMDCLRRANDAGIPTIIVYADTMFKEQKW